MDCIDLNCDMGEGLTTDALIMPFISSANIACGFHAGDEDSMKRTVELALQQHVAIGAHPGFEDKQNVGRTEMQLPLQQVYELVSHQIEKLQKVCASFHTYLHHVKPHGALYNMATKDTALANIIAKAVNDIDSRLIVYGLSGSFLLSESSLIHLNTASEVFADRHYEEDGSLVSRNQSNAVIENEEQSIQQVLQMIRHQSVISSSGQRIPIVAETICLHGDGKQAVQLAQKINQSLQQNGITIQSIEPID